MSGKLDLYHRTSIDAARAILASGRFVTCENTREAFTSNRVDGQAAGYGDAVVHVRVDEDDAQLDDEFPDGEQHYRIPLDRAEVVDAFTVDEAGRRTPLAAAATASYVASFPRPAQAHTVTAATAARTTTNRAATRTPQIGR